MSNLKENITNVKLVISFLELLEESRGLSIQEWNFREILCEKLRSLLRQQKIYWKQEERSSGSSLVTLIQIFFMLMLLLSIGEILLPVWRIVRDNYTQTTL